MTITYQLESWDNYYRDCQGLWSEHYDEIAVHKEKMPMAPDIETFRFLESRGQLQILVAREKGLMVGYQLTMIRRHLHYPTLCGFEDSYFLTKSKRKGLTGFILIREAIRHMKARGVEKIFFMTKCSLDRGKLLERLGFSMCDNLYSLWTGN